MCHHYHLQAGTNHGIGTAPAYYIASALGLASLSAECRQAGYTWILSGHVQTDLVTMVDQALRQLIYVILNSTKVWIEEVTDHQYAVPPLGTHGAYTAATPGRPCN